LRLEWASFPAFKSNQREQKNKRARNRMPSNANATS
jgi:hypothetical protein